MDLLRLLNFDDLFLMRQLLLSSTLTAAATSLNLTQPAATQRIRKIEKVFALTMFDRAGRGVTLTSEARTLCEQAESVLALLATRSPTNTASTINIGTRAEVGMSWLAPAIEVLRRKEPMHTFHIHFGSGEEILRQLGGGVLDAVLSSAPLVSRDFDAIEIAREDYVFVCATKLKPQIRTVKDLNAHVLIEHDRSFPFLRYVPAAQRAQFQFSDVWFLGSSLLMTRAIVQGFGVGIIPEYLAKPHLDKKRLTRIKLPVKLASDNFRLIYARQKNIAIRIERLAQELKRTGLR